VPLTRRYALMAWGIAFLAVLFTPLIPGQNRVDTAYYMLLAVTFAVAGFRYGPRYAWGLWAAMLLPVWLWTGSHLVYPLVDTGWLALLALVLHAVWLWRRDRSELAAQTALAEREGERSALLEKQSAVLEKHRAALEQRGAVLAERARIAREMHDVVAHHLSMVAVQAETAPYRVPDLSETAQREFAALSAAAREGLTEMRRLLGVLRSDTGGAAPKADNSNRRGSALTPQPCLDDIPALIETARRAGAQVTADVRDSVPGTPASVGLAAYRIVQESLSNAARHAPGTRVSVVIEQEPSSVRITVVNEPPTDPSLVGHGLPAGRGPGHGLTGMRERAELLGGELAAGPEPGGGFAVRALLPLGDDVVAGDGVIGGGEA
jgi:signal transduction histidine kinase